MSSPTLVLIVVSSMLVLLFELVLANQGPVTVALLEVAMRPLLEEDLHDAHVAHLVLLPWSSNMPYLVHVLFKQYYLSNVDAQNQSLFKQCNLSNVKNSKSGNISKSGNEVLKNFEFNKIIFDTKNYQSW